MKTAKNEREWKRKESHNQRAVRQAVETNKHKKAISNPTDNFNQHEQT